MLASRFESTSLPDTMADDTMEISSDHGHNTGGEDIDIDIDFTAGHVDEDYILEDAASNAGFGDSFQPQPSPALGHDDLMLDDGDGDESYPMHMDGADIMRDNEHSMEDEPLEIPSAPADIPAVHVDESPTGATSHVEDGVMNDEVSWEADDEPTLDHADSNANLEDRDAQHASHEIEADRDLEKIQTAEVIEEPSTSTPIMDPQSNSPLTRSPNSPAVGQESGNTPNNAIAAEVESQNRGPIHPVEVLDGSSVSQEVVSTLETVNTDEKKTSPVAPEVVVTYQDSDYSLFPKTETDDTDSYFISDLSVVDKPLSKLFESLRSVIHNDLSDEDELCISVEELGLDIEETCLAAQSVTIGQLISLHERLLQNDGAEPVRPCSVVLGTRPNFLVRFAILVSGASEGKGLSEIVQWDEKSEIFDDFAQVTDNEQGEALDGERNEVEESIEDNGKTDGGTISPQKSSDDALPQDSTAEQAAPQEKGNTESFGTSEITASTGTHGGSNSFVEQAPTEESFLLRQNEIVRSGEDEDGDLIDYSDEEDQTHPELRKDPNPRPTKLATNDYNTHNEYEAINAELQRRSSSRTAEDNSVDTTEPLVANEVLVNNHEPNAEAETGVEYNENDEENNAEDFDELASNVPTADYDEAQHTESYDGSGDVNGGEIVDDHDLTTGPGFEDDQEPYNGFDFEDDDNVQHQQLPAFDGQESRPNDSHLSGAVKFDGQLPKENFSTGSSLGFADAPSSESATSEKTLEAQPITTEDPTIDLNEENEDEIDYDDDEEPNVVQFQESDKKEPQALNNGSTKRQRTDDDDSPNAESKEAKRPRS